MDVGLGRTGTMSLKFALEELGFDKCYHFSGMHKNPEHIDLWRAVARGESVDWESMFQGYQATVYWSPTYDYQSLLRQHPDIKVILTVREPEKWYKSMYETIYTYNRLTLSRKLLLNVLSLFRPGLKNLHAMWQLQEEILWKKTFDGRFHDKEYAISVFIKHIEEVKKNVPPERLLVYKIQDGWEPLCQFLQVDQPETPFPRVNDSDAFKEWRKQIFTTTQ
ncbi:MAG: sulfotransferase family protein [Candidatus Electrothrix sp. AW2]|nr:sulfotransferase family protein [Candidatus Electrothrix gigas]